MAFAREHGFKIISVADLIAYRQRRERLVEQTAQFDVEHGHRQGQRLFLCDALRCGGAAGARLRRRLVRQEHPGAAAPRECARGRVRQRAGRSTRRLRHLQARGLRHSGLSAGGRAGRAGRASWRPRNPAVPRSASRPGAMSASARRSCATSMCSSIRLISSSNRHYVGLSGFGIEIAETIKIEG